MSGARVTVTTRRPARPEALVVFDDARLPAAVREEVRRRFRAGARVAVVPALGRGAAGRFAAARAPRTADPFAWRCLGGAVARALADEPVRRGVVLAPERLDGDALAALVLGLSQGSYRFDRYRSRPGSRPPAITLVAATRQAAARARQALPVAAAVEQARDWINTPAEDLGPSEFEAEARRVAREHGLSIRVLDAERCRRLGMGALTAVGRASDDPPRLVIVEHRGAGRRGGFFALAGKGICFDTGGLDLKTASGMELMKKDMGGAATVLAAVAAAADLGLALDVRGYLALAENAVSGNAIRPGDVLTALDGTTIEIVNTDAEGRLVLADAVALARREGATHVVDAATLTGAALVALGRARVPMMATDDALARALEQAAERSGEKVWRMPTDEEYRRQIRSEIADIRNMGKGREAGVIAAGLFIAHFAGDLPWGHLDISPAAWAEGAHDLGPKGATGVMVSTLVELLRAHTTT
ncbi:MAG: leucyl aminopeptidase [Acidobacteria bacterium]|nr:MAG: leucyl aminopeptidase [Acidobacteriota bacterium]